MASRNLPIVDWIQIDSSAPGKFIISGEYSVVYEKQAIASAIDLRTKVTIRPNKDGKVVLKLNSLDAVREWPTSCLTTCRLISKYSECLEFTDNMPIKLNHLLHAKYIPGKQDLKTASTSTQEIESKPKKDSQPLTPKGNKETDKKADDAAIAFLLLYIGLGDSYCGSARPPIEVEVDSKIPVGSGLGSSSAYSVALCGALMRVFRVAAEKYIISNWAFNIDKFFHGRPSGVDNNVVTFGGFILFQNGKIKANGISHRNSIRVMLIDTCVSRSTRGLSEGVATKLREDPNTIGAIFNNINEITSQMWRRIIDPDFKPHNIIDCIHANQQCLDALGVGHEKLTDICAKAQQHELAAKQTGAGGGGTAFVLYDATDDRTHIEQLKRDLEDAGYRIHDHSVGSDGLSVKMTRDPDMKFSLGGDH